MFNFLNMNAQTIYVIMFYLILIFGMYFIMVRPQRNKSKQDEQMRKNIKLGDEIVTIGGIIGTVINIKNDSIVVETGNDKIHIKKWAISDVINKK